MTLGGVERVLPRYEKSQHCESQSEPLQGSAQAEPWYRQGDHVISCPGQRTPERERGCNKNFESARGCIAN